MTMTTTPIKLYRNALSGHSHRVELMLSLLGLPFERVDVDIARGEHRSADFLAKNPLGQIPVIEDGDLTLADSTAILTYLALRYDASGRYLPREPIPAAQVQRWLSIASGELFRGPGALRLARIFRRPRDPLAEQTAVRLLTALESELTARTFLVGEAPTIADLAIYTYTAHAPEGDLSLEPYPAVRAWLARIEALPGFVAMAPLPLSTAT